MLRDEVGYACKINGKMDADLYVSILDDGPAMLVQIGIWIGIQK